jgi:hypothetical protein
MAGLLEEKQENHKLSPMVNSSLWTNEAGARLLFGAIATTSTRVVLRTLEQKVSMPTRSLTRLDS